MIVVIDSLFIIAISGDVYKDYPSFHPRVCETLKALIPSHVSAKLSVGIVKFSRIVGAAIVAMMVEKWINRMWNEIAFMHVVVL